ncbi:succinylglutamate desuccinylase [Thalassotalea sp. LPB0316]|uniref:succinylglutamate desuccinylase n=1 Tax=Thalassotalea sp. LPB0316 TaxID=2769490 RepID=UPI0018665240|nr:succinylglutamate desuccinylase [Thalassotalea sp. LPB0316]QOL24355.1 succinylglutamate desuccinylase [Thalassotalea sp. LPB0316]
MANTAAQLKASLIKTGDFLSLTRQHEWHMPAFDFVIESTDYPTKVSVLDTGIIVFEPQTKTQKDIVLSCAVHGNETAPIEICAELVQQAILGQVTLTERVLFLFGNPAAMNIAERFVEENLNRLFSGAHSQDGGLKNKERVRAKVLEDAVRDFFEATNSNGSERERKHYDLHTAIRESKNDKFAVYPFRHGKPWKTSELSFLQACGVSTILLSHSPTTTFSYFSSNNFGADAFTVELGKVRPFGENDMSQFSDVKKTLKALITGKDLNLKPFDEAEFSIFEIDQTINRTRENFVLHFPDDAKNFTDYPVDYLLASDGDIEYRVRTEGEAIIFPNANVALGQRALLTVKPTKL